MRTDLEIDNLKYMKGEFIEMLTRRKLYYGVFSHCQSSYTDIYGNNQYFFTGIEPYQWSRVLLDYTTNTKDARSVSGRKDVLDALRQFNIQWQKTVLYEDRKYGNPETINSMDIIDKLIKEM